MRKVISIIFDLIGLAGVFYGCWSWFAPLGWVVLGLGIFVIAHAIYPLPLWVSPESDEDLFDLPPDMEPAEPEARAAVAPPGLDWGPQQ